jgi:hypothetical protein
VTGRPGGTTPARGHRHDSVAVPLGRAARRDLEGRLRGPAHSDCLTGVRGNSHPRRDRGFRRRGRRGGKDPCSPATSLSSVRRHRNSAPSDLVKIGSGVLSRVFGERAQLLRESVGSGSTWPNPKLLVHDLASLRRYLGPIMEISRRQAPTAAARASSSRASAPTKAVISTRWRGEKP